MNKRQITTSAALFCEPDKGRTVSLRWYDKARELFHRHCLEPMLFTASGGDYAYDDCYVLADAGGDLVMWEEPIPAKRQALVEALQSGLVEYLGLDSPRAGSASRSDSRAAVNASAWSGKIYAGIDEQLMSDPAELLRWVFEIAKDEFDVRYGFAYKMPLDDGPGRYASWFVRTSVAEVFEFIRNRSEWDARPKTPDQLWSDELYERRRHLTGLFRGAYPASILCDAHLQTARMHSQPVGQLSKLDESRWLWELSESEIPKAEAMLRAEYALVSQITQP